MTLQDTQYLKSLKSLTATSDCSLSAQLSKVITLLWAGWTMAFLIPTWIWSLQRSSGCYPVPAKQLRTACLPFSCSSQHHGALPINGHDCLCSEMPVSKQAWAAAPQRQLRCFFKQHLLVLLRRLRQVGFANKTTNNAPVEEFYRALCFWVFNNHMWSTTNKAPGYKEHSMCR